MKRNILYITGMILIFCLIGTVSAATTLNVDYTNLNCDDTGDDLYCTIQEAIDAADNGDTIEVAAGTYTNDIWDSILGIPTGYRITKSVTLLGAQAGVNPDGSTDRGGETILLRNNGVPYSLYASGITIDGFTFTSGMGSGGGRLVISDEADNAIIKNCIIKDISGTDPHGVYIYPGADNALIEYNTFSNTAWEAIASWQVSNAVISHNHISSSGQHAIQMMGHSGGNNEISYNHISGIVGKNAIQYWGGSGAIITNNVIEGEGTMFDGIWLDEYADGSTVSNNQISGTIYAGINVRGGCIGTTVTNNDISGCGTGVETHVGTTGALVNYNNIAGNSWGVRNYDTETLNAEYNWWGDDGGPTHSTNQDGIGDAVSSHVDYIPWLDSIGNPVWPGLGETTRTRNKLSLPENAVEVSPGVFYLGKAMDNGKVVEGYAFVHYAKSATSSKPVWDDTEDIYKFMFGGIKWDSDMTYKIDTSTIPSGLSNDEVKTVLEISLGKWNSAIGSDSTQFGLTDNPNENNVISWDDLSSIYGANVIAVNSFWYYTATKEMIESDVTFNTYYTWSVADTCSGNMMDLQSIATHEFGHNGLNDLYMPPSIELTMHGYSYGYCETHKRTLGDGDILGIQALYGV